MMVMMLALTKVVRMVELMVVMMAVVKVDLKVG